MIREWTPNEEYLIKWIEALQGRLNDLDNEVQWLNKKHGVPYRETEATLRRSIWTTARSAGPLSN